MGPGRIGLRSTVNISSAASILMIGRAQGTTRSRQLAAGRHREQLSVSMASIPPKIGKHPTQNRQASRPRYPEQPRLRKRRPKSGQRQVKPAVTTRAVATAAGMGGGGSRPARWQHLPSLQRLFPRGQPSSHAPRAIATGEWHVPSSHSFCCTGHHPTGAGARGSYGSPTGASGAATAFTPSSRSPGGTVSVVARCNRTRRPTVSVGSSDRPISASSAGVISMCASHVVSGLIG